MPGHQQANLNLRIWGCKDMWMSTSTHEPEGMRMWGWEYTCKYTWTWGYEMQGCKDIHMNLRIQESMEVRLEQSTLENTFFAYIY